MNTYKLRILFVIALNRIKKNNQAPIFCRITYNKKRKQFSTGISINPNDWDSEKQIVSESDKNYKEFNTQLSLIKQNINQAFLLLQVNGKVFDVEDIYLQYTGKNVKANKTLLEVFELHNNRMNKLIGVEYTKSTYNKFIEAKNHVSNFIRFQYKKGDLLLNDIKLNFLENFDFYLKSEKNHKQITINKTIQRLRKIIKLSISEDFLTRDPFLLYKPKRHDTKVVFLTVEELSKIEQYQFAQKRLEQVRDMFVFCCYTGLAYAEMSSLSKKHIINGFDNNQWIHMYRKKTNKWISVPLLEKPIIILNKYSEICKDKVLPIISNQKFNSYLKEIASITGVDKNLTHHIARKTFASTILLYNDVPMEIVSELLGHSSITITEAHYGKIVQKKVSAEINKLKLKL